MTRSAHRLRIAALAAVLATAAAGCGTDEAPRVSTVSCDDVAFTANSDDMAADIRATGVGCAQARTFVRDTDGSPGSGARGYTCTSRRVDGGTLIHTEWRCSQGDKTIAWSRF